LLVSRMNHRYASEREATAAAKRLRPEQQHEWSSVSVFRKVWKRGSQRPAPLCSGSASQDAAGYPVEHLHLY
ncbi:hypothetical protein, partial [Vibrio parahaemolyticus]|uniref:hypothetical protein n=2 Tax=Vibrio parahaemolyticus TaxID=670 RepID=UPI004037D7FF